jgi:clan AA aspartic protease (TIGR02281 family)
MRAAVRGLMAAVAVAVLCVPAGAQIVRWTDERGEVHITDADSVPERHRGSAEVLSRPRSPTAPGDPAGSLPSGVASVASGTTVIHFRPGKPIMAVARINGSAIVSLMIDTGADSTAIHASVIKALGVDLGDAPDVRTHGVGGTSRARVVVLDRLEVGGATVAPLRVYVMEEDLPGQGLIGRDFLRHFRMSVDNKAGILTLRTR